MATYLMFGKYSQSSIGQISSERTEQAKDLVKSNRGKIKDGYALLGKYDLVLITEFPDTERAMKSSVALSEMLGISFTTAPAVTIQEFDKMMG